MFRATYSRAAKFKYVTQALTKINDEGYLEVSNDGLRFWLMSPDKTSMAVVFMPAYSFEEFTVESEVKLTIRTDEFNKIVRRAAKNDNLTLEFNPVDQLIYITLTDRRTGISRQFTLTPVSLAGEEYRELKLEPKVKFTIDPKDFKLLVQDSKIIGDTITFKAETDHINVIVRSEDKEYIWTLKPGDPLLDLEVVELAESSYSRTALEVAAKPTSASTQVRVEYATNYPIQINFELPGEEKMIIYIAPVLE
ncbi:MAG: DNA polymerase sliding clamp [Acidilobaceae archaeon]